MISYWLCNLPCFRFACNRVFKFLPADRIHGVARLAFGHDHSEFVSCSSKVVIRLVSKADLQANI